MSKQGVHHQHRGAWIASTAVVLCASAVVASAGEAESVQLTGVIRDFVPGHAAFSAERPDDFYDVHVSGLLEQMLNDRLNPVFTGEGNIVESQATDAFGYPIAPDNATAGAPLDNFDIVGGHLVPKEQFSARITLLGAAIETGSYHLPVTTRLRVGDQVFEPFGGYDSPATGNVNDNQDVTGNRNVISHEFELPGEFPPDTVITIDGTSWLRQSYKSGTENSHWYKHLSASSLDNSVQVRVLRNGDPVPNINGAFSQASVGEYVSEYVDQESQTMRLESNEVIWLFELGTTSMSNGDFQDLVVLVTLATGDAAFDGPTTQCGDFLSDNEATLGAPSDGAMSTESVDDWFTTKPSINAAANHTISLEPASGGMYEFATPDFTPIDKKLFGNESEHNRSFTYEAHAKFEYDGCSSQMVEFEGGGDVWVFINGVLVMDMGGSGIKAQRIDLDRLNLTDGGEYRLSFFYVNRRADESPFRLRTNLRLRSSAAQLPPTLHLRD